MSAKKNPKTSKGRKGKKNVPEIPEDDTPKIDWTTYSKPDVSLELISGWFHAAAGAIRENNVEMFKEVIKDVTPTNALVEVFDLHRGDPIQPPLFELVIVRGCTAILEKIITCFGAARIFQAAPWKGLTPVHLAAVWGHVEIVEMLHDEVRKDPANVNVNINSGEIVTIALRYGHQTVSEYYGWYELRTQYRRLLLSAARLLRKAIPPEDSSLFPADEIDRYLAGVEEKIEQEPSLKFKTTPTSQLIQLVAETYGLRCISKSLQPRPDQMDKRRGRSKKPRKK